MPAQRAGHVGGLEHRSVELAPEYRHLVADHDDLDREVLIRAEEQADELEDGENAR